MYLPEGFPRVVTLDYSLKPWWREGLGTKHNLPFQGKNVVVVSRWPVSLVGLMRLRGEWKSCPGNLNKKQQIIEASWKLANQRNYVMWVGLFISTDPSKLEQFHYGNDKDKSGQAEAWKQKSNNIQRWRVQLNLLVHGETTSDRLLILKTKQWAVKCAILFETDYSRL